MTMARLKLTMAFVSRGCNDRDPQAVPFQDLLCQFSQWPPAAIAVAAALVAHLGFNRLQSAQRKIGVWGVLLVGVPIGASVEVSFVHSISLISSIVRMYAVFVPSILASLAFYRLSPFHPLAAYPGPLINKLTLLRMAYATYTGKKHLYMHSLHKKYGSHVRIGPNAVSIVHADAIKECLGSPHMQRDMLYRASEPDAVPPSLISSLSLSVEDHATKRKVWSQAFTGPAVKQYDPYINARSDTYMERLQQQQGVIDLVQWLGFFTYDFMGDLMFGGGFDMLREGDKGGYWKFIRDTMKVAKVTDYMTYLANVLPYLPVSRGYKSLAAFVLERLEIRMNAGPVTRDLFHYVSREDEVKVEKSMLPSFMTDVIVGIVAGADTTTVVMACTFHTLMINPSMMDKLRAEIDANFDRDEDPTDALKLSAMPYLNAVLHETLRMYPAVPTHVSRTPNKGSGGKVVGGRFVPEGTAITLPIYSYHRDPKHVQPDPERFWPERWIEGKKQPGMFVDPNVYVPFSFGPGHCIGKHIALRGMRVMIARTLQKFNLEFEKGYDPALWYDGLEDAITMAKGKLPVVLSLRK